jgi:hypothetical protein
MPVGNVPTQAQLNAQIAQLATQWRSAALASQYFQAYVSGLGTAGLIAIGFSSPDATTLLTQANYMLSLSQIYQGTLQQGGTGGTGAILFNFENALVTSSGPY